MSDMVHRLFEEHSDVAVMECVEDVAAASLADHKPQMTQNPQLMGDSRLFHTDRFSKLANRTGTLFQAGEDQDTAGSRQSLHRLGYLPGGANVDGSALCFVLDAVTHLAKRIMYSYSLVHYVLGA
jgi:hypothetical protein